MVVVLTPEISILSVQTLLAYDFPSILAQSLSPTEDARRHQDGHLVNGAHFAQRQRVAPLEVGGHQQSNVGDHHLDEQVGRDGQGQHHPGMVQGGHGAVTARDRQIWTQFFICIPRILLIPMGLRTMSVLTILGDKMTSGYLRQINRGQILGIWPIVNDAVNPKPLAFWDQNLTNLAFLQPKTFIF